MASQHASWGGTAAVRAGEALLGRLHHGDGARRVQVGHVHVQGGKHMHGLFHRVGDVMELQVQENPMSPGLDLPHDGRAFGVEQLHADFQKGFALLVLKEVEEPEGVFRRLEVAGYDYIVLHNIQI